MLTRSTMKYTEEDSFSAQDTSDINLEFNEILAKASFLKSETKEDKIKELETCEKSLK